MTKPRSGRAGGLGLADVASWVVAGLLLCWSGIPAGPAAAAEGAGSTAPRLTGAAGTVEVRAAGADAWERAAVGRELKPGDAIRTGALSKAEVTHAAGTIRLFEQTVLRLPMRVEGGVKRVDRVEMLAGQSLFDVVVPARLQDLVARVSAGARALLFEVVTPHIVAGVKGTRFAVAERGERSVVAVYSGTVETSDRARTAEQTAALGAWQRAEYADSLLTGVSSFDGTLGFESWSDPGMQVAPGLETAMAGPDTAVSEVAAADAGSSPTGNSPTGNSPTGNSPAGNSPAGNSPAGNSPAGNSPAGNSPAGGRGGRGGGTAASPGQ